jgi:hypothetical protein
MGAQVEHTTDSQEDGACNGQATAAKSNHFTANTIFLIHEHIKRESGGKEFGCHVKKKIEVTVANEQLDIC